jgi:OFA family oxalate/formate antiporter-like MFS transporter
MKKPFVQIPFNPARWPFFYGWLILFWGVVGIILSVPGQTTGVAAFIEPLIESLQISRLQISAAYLFGTLSAALFLTPAGKLFDRIGARWMGFGSCLVLGIVLLLLSQTDRMIAATAKLIPEQWAALGILSLLFLLLRLSGQGVLTMSSRNMVMKWFDRHRGLASGISGAAVAFGFSYAPTLFNGIIQHRGWSNTWFLIGILLVGVFAPLLLLFFRDNPEECGLVPDGRAANATDRKLPKVHHQFTLAEARCTFPFWAFSLTISLQALAITAVTFHIESIFTMAGMTGADGFALFPPAALIAIAVNLCGGWLSDRMELRWLLITMLLAMGGYMMGLMLLADNWTTGLIIVSYGTSSGLFGILMSVVWPRYYGRKHLGAISGLCMTFMGVFSAFGPASFSGILQISGSYTAAYIACLLAAALLLIGAFFARNPQCRQAGQPSK